MQSGFWVKLDAYLFRVLGVIFGVGGVGFLFANNPREKLLSNTYGIAFLALFIILAAYSIASLVMDILGSGESSEKNG
ncbi:MAG: hypothetical protein HY804_06080 [Nitrospinae bacterium]|nr:hypothetical protein [Nitrospinota bacterium]